jgi:hypothetical protein
MYTESQTSKKGLLTGRIISALVVAFLLFDGAAKVAQVQAVLEASAELGYPTSSMPFIGLILVVSALLYAFPKTSFFGALLLTAYLGGATATHVRMAGPVFPMVFAPLFGVLVWVGLVLRDARLRALILSPKQQTA